MAQERVKPVVEQAPVQQQSSDKIQVVDNDNSAKGRYLSKRKSCWRKRSADTGYNSVG